MDEPLRILLLEDHPPDAELLERELRREGLRFSLQLATTSEAFHLAMKSFSPQVILSDSGIPGFSGMEALALARRLVPDIPFIFVSGMSNEDRKTVALQRGASDYVDKVRLERIVSAIARSLESKKGAP